MANGALYSFHVRYQSDPPVINLRFASTGASAGPPLSSALVSQALEIFRASDFMYKAVRSGGIHFRLRKVYIREQLLWLGFECSNLSPIDFEGGAIHCYLRDRRHSMLQKGEQAVQLEPLLIHHSSGSAALSAGACDSIAIAFKPFYVGSGKLLELEWREKDGSRLIRLRLKGKFILRARNWRATYETDH